MAIAYLGDLAGDSEYLNRCDADNCVSSGATATVRAADALMRKLHKSRSESIRNTPDLMYLRVLVDGEEDIHYSLMVNKSYKHVSSLLGNEANDLRDQKNDTLTVVRGFSGSYPNVFLAVPFDKLDEFIEDSMKAKDMDEYQQYVAKYAIRRTNDSFWEHSDWFQKKFAEAEPVEAGILDLNRYSPF
jgi:hypothetical protein